MNELSTVRISNIEVSVKEYKNQRVVTFKDIDLCHERPDGTARRNFNSNKKHFIEGTDYFKVCANEIRTHKIMSISNKAHEDIILLTESGYLMLVKPFHDDLAWDVQRELVKSYFRQSNHKNNVYAANELLGNPEFAIQVFTKLKEEKEKREEAELKIRQQEPLVAFANKVSSSTNLIDMNNMAKLLCDNNIKIGRNKLFEFLRSIKVLMSSNIPYQQYINAGYFKVVEYSYSQNGESYTQQITRVTGKGQLFIAKKVMDRYSLAV